MQFQIVSNKPALLISLLLIGVKKADTFHCDHYLVAF